MDNFEHLIGKTIKEMYKPHDGMVTIVFDDESRVTVEIDYINTSCHCHPEYEYYLDIQSHS